ncbi:MAG: cysteine--tRNA ligase [Paenibacillaceae bacterium]
MTLSIYSTMTRKKESFVPLTEGQVRMYVCGPTVYDYIHIGNARPLIFFDVVRRYLEFTGYEVTFVVNFTDVDDKLIRKSEQTSMSVPELANKYIDQYYVDTQGLRVRAATVHPRVTNDMAEIIVYIEELVGKSLAYESGGDVYFRTARFPEYGKLSKQNTDELQFGIRVEVDERKEDERDFVLWKQAKPGEISWSSPWGEGRPGWHIECSAMARKYLGDTLDIHGGGHDLQFPHHECEIAQSESLTGKPLANYWMHNGYIHIKDEKMSKSLGNGINVSQLLERYRAEAIRYFVLSTHYRNPLNFSEETMEQATNAIERIETCLANLRHRLGTVIESEASDVATEKSAYQLKISAIVQEFRDKMDDDFNTADAITAIFDWVTETNHLLQLEHVSYADLVSSLATFTSMNEVLGLAQTATNELLDEEVDGLIVERNDARQQKNWARADEIRDILSDQGILLEDTPQGLRWRRK